MAEPGGGNGEKKSQAETQQFTVKLPSFDANFQVTAVLETDKDPARPPSLVNVSTTTIESSTSPPVPEAETHIILSTGSGHQEAEFFFNQVLGPILNALDPSKPGNWALHVTQSATSILTLTERELFAKANSGQNLRVILASGDGGIVDLVNGLSIPQRSSSYKSPQVILLPLGTANALYHSINAISGREGNTWGLHALSSVQTRPLPIFKATFSPGVRLLVNEGKAEEELPRDEHGNSVLYGAVVCSWGMHASLVADSDTAAYRKFGAARFKMAAQEALHPSDGSAPHAYQAKISTLKNSTNQGSESWIPIAESQFMYVLATLVSHLEAPFCISPVSRPLDGSLRLVRFGPTTGENAMRIMGQAYAGGKHVEDEAVGYEEIEGLKIAFGNLEEDGRWRRVCVDGKIVRVEGDGWIEVRKEEKSVVDILLG